MTEIFNSIHKYLEDNEPLYKGTQLYFSPRNEAEILFIGINPGIGYFKFYKENVKRFSPLSKFEYNSLNYNLAKQTKKIFNELNLGMEFSKSVKINHFPFATRNENDLNKLLEKRKSELKLYSVSKEIVLSTITEVKPKLIICEGKSSFDRLKKYLKSELIEYNKNTYVLKHKDIIVIGYKRRLSYILDKNELKDKIQKYYKNNS